MGNMGFGDLWGNPHEALRRALWLCVWCWERAPGLRGRENDGTNKGAGKGVAAGELQSHSNW